MVCLVRVWFIFHLLFPYSVPVTPSGEGSASRKTELAGKKDQKGVERREELSVSGRPGQQRARGMGRTLLLPILPLEQGNQGEGCLAYTWNGNNPIG